ncbi:MAG: PUR family DNA/RNA-binding protein [Cytophagales bacterium]|nr:PUR family DNA/RNA-binding protein [Cytophagales bacterium]
MEEQREKDELYSKRVRAGKRTYFFDVKSTRANDYYLTITESKRRFNTDGSFVYEKHKVFLYKEDFDKFIEALREAVDHVKTDLMPDFDFSQFEKEDYENAAENEGGESELKWE